MKSEMPTEEKWIQLKKFNNFYSVSNLGRVKSHYREIHNGIVIEEKILKPIVASNGYHIINLTYPKRKQYLIHRLVCEAFLWESKLTVNHKDFNKVNNTLNNLEYCTQKENILHSIIGNKNGQILLDSNYGIFYNTYQEASNALTIKISKLYKIMAGLQVNKTSLIKI